MDDGTEQEFGLGQVSYVPPSHDAWVVGNEPFVARLYRYEGIRYYFKVINTEGINLLYFIARERI